MDEGHRTPAACINYKLTYEPTAQASKHIPVYIYALTTLESNESKEKSVCF